MRAELRQNKSEDDVYRQQEKSNSRINLNDLLKRAKDQKKLDDKKNLLIFSSAASIAAIVLLILSF